MNTGSAAAVEEYLVDSIVEPDATLQSALAASSAAGLPAISVSPLEGKLLHLLAKMRSAKRILEIGTLGGYSTIWLARALPADGQLITLEFDPKHAEVAQQNLKNAGVADRVQIIVGPAVDSLPKLTGPFDFIFIDADKSAIPAYFEWSLNLGRSGTVIVVDNIVRQGQVIDTQSTDASVIGLRKFIAQLRGDKRVSATGLQTVGSKGYDGFALVRVE